MYAMILSVVTLTEDELRTIENDPNGSSILAIYRSSKSLFDVGISLAFFFIDLIDLHLDSCGLCSLTKTKSNSHQ